MFTRGNVNSRNHYSRGGSEPMRGNRGIRNPRLASRGACQSNLNVLEATNNQSKIRNIRSQGCKRGSNINSLTREDALTLLSQIKTDSYIIEKFLENGKLLKLFITSKSFNRGDIFTLLKSICNFCEFDCNEDASVMRKILEVISRTNFIEEVLQKNISSLFLEPPSVLEIETLLQFFIIFYNNCPNVFEKMSMLSSNAFMFSLNFQEEKIKSLIKEYEKAFNHAKDYSSNSNELGKIKLKERSESNFRTIPIVPGVEDIFCLNEDIKLSPIKFSEDNSDNHVRESVDDYLSTHFRLLREDFIRPLRESIEIIRKNSMSREKLYLKDINVRIYEKVIIENLLPSRNGLVYKIKFDVSKFSAKMDWKKSRRFIHGSLLCFTNNYFDTLLFSIVVDSNPNDLSKGNLMVQFENDPISEILSNNEFLMLETKNLFEAYRHVLNKLQKFNSITLPFPNYFVFGKNEYEMPKYLRSPGLFSLINNYSDGVDSKMDGSQSKAFHKSINANISLIQGPPGTGKTFVGLKIIKYLHQNFQISSSNNIGPILIVCYTNHALDQFLEDIVSTIGSGNIIRVGGRSKIKSIQECNINIIKGKWITKKAFPHYIFKNFTLLKQSLEEKEIELVNLYIKITNNKEKFLSKNDLYDFMNIKEKLYFQKIDFESWLKGCDVEVDSVIGNLRPNIGQLVKDINTGLLHRIITELLNEIVEAECLDILDKEDEFEPEIEDPDEYIFNQRFLDEDVDLIKSINKYKLLYEDNEFDNENNEHVDYCDGFKTVANTKLIKRKLKRTKPLSEEEYQCIVDFNLTFDVRLRLYKYWLGKYQIGLLDKYKGLMKIYESLNRERSNLNDMQYELIMKSTKIIGMTTTGAARYSSVLDRVGCKVVVIEEAAEVLEAHVISALSKNCEHLIMIGDHKQLRPKVDVYDLEVNYNLSISLFERLISNNCEYSTLQYQHRMRPEISKCVKPIYPDLLDDDKVFHYSSIKGMGTNMYFFNHCSLEEESEDRSYKNNFEAEFISEFCKYLLKSDNVAKSITIITFYTGQLYNISRCMKDKIFKNVRICVLDNFQGEENDIIILSLVRSNNHGNIGFLKSPNRLCVALSRAKRGFYVIGNISMLTSKIPLMKEIIDCHVPKENIGNKLPLGCTWHSDQPIFVTRPQDFQNSCQADCGMELSCGHLCTLKCHLDRISHKSCLCRKPCLKKCKRNQHDCKQLCYMKCLCKEMIDLVLNCGHQIKSECYISNELVKCEEPCKRILNCNHKCSEKCGNKCICKEMMNFLLPCGHYNDAICGSKVEDIKCLNECDKKLECGHPCVNLCCKTCKCSKLVRYRLSCGHSFLHCNSDLSGIKCPKIVIKKFDCQHQISSECWRISNTCTQLIIDVLKCGHKYEGFCGSKTKNFRCREKCNYKFECQHTCQSLCYECFDKPTHNVCEEICKNLLDCGIHQCQKVCHLELCAPCQDHSCINMKEFNKSFSEKKKNEALNEYPLQSFSNFFSKYLKRPDPNKSNSSQNKEDKFAEKF